MKKVYMEEKSQLIKQNDLTETIFTDELIKDLPEPIKKHLDVCGYMNTAVPVNANVHWKESFF